jgi:uncharacterized protein YbaR (Trm112 family)
MNAEFLKCLECPKCATAPLLVAKDSPESLQCPACQAKFPAVDGIPALFAQPAAWHAEWSISLELFLHTCRFEEQIFETELSRADLLLETRSRLERLLYAKQKTREAVEELLGSFRAPTGSLSLQALTAQSNAKPLLYHYVNILRDWCWGEEENRASLELISKSCPLVPAGSRILILGAGAARLAVDLHREWKPSLTVALDYNPLLVLAANKILKGTQLDLFEFPLVPVSRESSAVLCECSADLKPGPEFQLLFSDAMRAPFVEAAFDLLVTPWFIDVNGEDPRTYFTRLNRLLPLDGRWVCFGPLGFIEKNPSRAYGLEEVLAIAREAGFEVSETHEDWIAYLDSGDTRQRRLEKLVAFTATKKKEVPLRTAAVTGPAWLQDPSCRVEMRPEITAAMQAAQWNVEMLSQIDGKRSLDEICANLGRKAKANPAIVSEMLKRLLQSIR